MNRLISAALVAGLLATPAAAFTSLRSADTAAAAMNVDKASFVKAVESAGTFEIESGRLAEQKASSADVKSFATRMIADHTRAAGELKEAARIVGNAEPQLSPKHAAMLKLLQDASGNDFQALYIDMQAVAHMEAVTLFTTYAKGGDDSAVKDFAAKTLPVLEEHRAHVHKLALSH